MTEDKNVDVLGIPPADMPDDIPDYNVEPGLEPIGEPESDVASEPNPEDSGDKVADIAPDGQPPTEPEQETQVDFRERAAQFQTKYQTALAIAKRHLNPKQYQAFKSDINSGKEPPQQVQDTNSYEDGMTAGQLLNQMKEIVANEVKTAIQTNRNYDLVERETNDNTAAIYEVINTGKFSKEEVQAAFDEASSYPINLDMPGGPSAKAKIVLKELMGIYAQKNMGQISHKAEIDAAKKGKNALATLQPPSAAPPEQPTKTFQQEALDALRRLKPKSGADLVGT